MNKLWLRLAVAALLLAAVAVGAASSARTAEVADTAIAGTPDIAPSAGISGGPLMMELAAEPAAVVYAEARGRGASKDEAGRAAKARKESNERAQGDVLQSPQQKGIGATPLYQVQTSYNGIAVQAQPGAAAEIAALPGVKAVHAIPLVDLDNHSSVPLIGALQAWGSYGNTGTGMNRGHRHRRRLRPPRLRRLRLEHGLGDCAERGDQPAAAGLRQPGRLPDPGDLSDGEGRRRLGLRRRRLHRLGGGRRSRSRSEPDGLQRPRHATWPARRRARRQRGWHDAITGPYNAHAEHRRDDDRPRRRAAGRALRATRLRLRRQHRPHRARRSTGRPTRTVTATRPTTST